MDAKIKEIVSYDLDSVDKYDFFTIKTMEEMMHTRQVESDIPHRHDYFMIMWVKKAIGKHIIDFETYNFENNCVFLLSPWQVHLTEFTQKPDGVVLMFSQDLLSRCGMSSEFMTNLNLFSEVDDNAPIRIPPKNTPKLQSIVDEVYHEMKQDDALKLDVISTYLKILLIECQRIRNKRTENGEKVTPARHLLIKKFKELVNQNYRELHQVKAYAERMSVTPSHLNNVISKTIGTTAKDFILNRIILEAKRMVYYSDLSLKEIAFALGFNDPAYFGKLFYKRNGISFRDFKMQTDK